MGGEYYKSHLHIIHTLTSSQTLRDLMGGDTELEGEELNNSGGSDRLAQISAAEQKRRKLEENMRREAEDRRKKREELLKQELDIEQVKVVGPVFIICLITPTLQEIRENLLSEDAEGQSTSPAPRREKRSEGRVAVKKRPLSLPPVLSVRLHPLTTPIDPPTADGRRTISTRNS